MADADNAAKGAQGGSSRSLSPRNLSPEARRALEEAAARRAAERQTAKETSQPREIGGRDGPDPTRYGDWEKKGIISDF